MHLNFKLLTTFQSLGLSEALVKALSESNIVEPTPIQAQAIPALVDSATDFLGLAQTGTGKTAAFGLPLIEQIDPQVKAIQAVILSPTRELAQQIARALTDFSKYVDAVSVEVVYGGTAITNQIKDLKRKRPNILVATPGRLIDLIDRKVLNLSNVRYVVLDEADEMLNMGFKEDIDVILSFTQEEKNTWLFSATMPKEIKEIVHRYMKDPVEVTISAEQKVNQNIEHRYTLVKGRDKRAALERIIDAESDMYALIFCRTKASTQSLSSSMASNGYPVEAIHGDLSQAQRNTVMRKFKSGSVRLLAATDVAARGIDVDNLTHVIHYDLPDDLAFYTHRSGRTARAGNQGVAVSLITPREQYKVRDLERKLSIKFKKVMIPSAEEVVMRHLQNKLDDLILTEASEEAMIWVHTFVESVDGLSKEDVLAKWFTQSMQGLKKQGQDLNAYEKGDRSEGRSDRSDRGDRKGKKGKNQRQARNGGMEEGMHRFYVNIGKDDNIQKGDLLKIVCDASGVRSRFIGRIQMFNRHSLVDVDESKSRGFDEAFKGLKFNGRRFKVSREE